MALDGTFGLLTKDAQGFSSGLGRVHSDVRTLVSFRQTRGDGKLRARGLTDYLYQVNVTQVIVQGVLARFAYEERDSRLKQLKAREGKASARLGARREKDSKIFALRRNSLRQRPLVKDALLGFTISFFEEEI
jgi:hypothetical protein